MYSDQVTAGAKRSIRDRLQGNFDDDYGRSRSTNANGKRQRQNDDKWKHDLYEDGTPQLSKPKVGTQDLRLKLQKKGKQQAYQGLKSSGVRDLREKLSGTMTLLPASSDIKKTKPRVQLEEVARTVKKNIPSAEEPVAEAKKPTRAVPSKKSQQKDESTVHGLLQSLGLEKYSITFQAEEVDMAALMHMTDDDLKALGIPMGPRKKILLALESKA